MTTAAPQGGLDRTAEEAGFYHEAGLGATWTGSRLAMGGLTFLFGSFVFAYFYLRSVNSNGRWHGSGFIQPSVAMGTTSSNGMPMIETARTTTVRMRTGTNRISASNPTAHDFNGSAAARSAICSTGVRATSITMPARSMTSDTRTSVPASPMAGLRP